MSGKGKPITERSEHIQLSMTERESACLKAATRGLRISIALLFTAAALEAAHRLGYYGGYTTSFRPRPRSWQDAPRRDEGETAKVRLTITMAPLFLRTIRRAAVEQLGADYRLSKRGQPAPVVAFILGAGLRYVATHMQSASLAQANPRLPSEEREEAAYFLHALNASGELSVLDPYLGHPVR